MKDTDSVSIRQFDISSGDTRKNISLQRNEVHVWIASLNKPVHDLQLLKQTLSDSERERANRFRFDSDRVRFIAAHGQLRMILARYVGIEPRVLDFASEQHGKPHLSLPAGPSFLKFNLSRSGDIGLIGITRDRNIGVDIEAVHQVVDFNGIVRDFFSPKEQAMFRTLPESERPKAFFRCWTCREAYLKATGSGLAASTKPFDVSPVLNGNLHEISLPESEDEAAGWSLKPLEPALGYVGAVAFNLSVVAPQADTEQY